MKKATFILEGSRDRSILMDARWPGTETCPVIVFAHGFKGYKDWGPWNDIATMMADHGFAFVKFNFSHNGGTIDHPIDFPDLKAFGENNYSTELKDLLKVITWLRTNDQVPETWNTGEIHLIGHSRGGGIALLAAGEDGQLASVTTWAGVADFEERFPSGDALARWKSEGVRYIPNARTGQNMPQSFQFYRDFEKHRDRLNIEQAVKHVQIPQFIVQGTKDETVNPENAKRLKKWNNRARLTWVEEGTHTFNCRHPHQPPLSESMQKVVANTLSFILDNAGGNS